MLKHHQHHHHHQYYYHHYYHHHQHILTYISSQLWLFSIIIQIIVGTILTKNSVVSATLATALTNYAFGYDIVDQTTGDLKSQHEIRNGDTVEGHYTFIQPDGNRRIVYYKADKLNGFVAIVKQQHDIKIENQLKLNNIQQLEKQQKSRQQQAINQQKGGAIIFTASARNLLNTVVANKPNNIPIYKNQYDIGDFQPSSLSSSSSSPSVLPISSAKINSTKLYNIPVILPGPPINSDPFNIKSSRRIVQSDWIPIISTNSNDANNEKVLLMNDFYGRTRIAKNKILNKPKRQYPLKIKSLPTTTAAPQPLIYQSAYRIHYALLPVRMVAKPTIKPQNDNPVYFILKKLFSK